MTPLSRRIAEDMQGRILSPCTQESHIQQVSLFARHFGTSLELLGPEQLRAYQGHLATERRLAPSSIGVAVSALRFLDGATLQKDWNIPEILPTPRQPAKLPVVASPVEVVSFLNAVNVLRNRVVPGAWSSASSRARTATSCSPGTCWTELACRKTRRAAGLAKRITPHSLHHSPGLFRVACQS